MSQSIPRIMQYAGLVVASAFLFNGVVRNPSTTADDAKLDASTSVLSSSEAFTNTKKSDSSIKASIAENYGKLPLGFEANNGQVDEAVKFLCRGNGYTLYLTSGEAVWSFRRASAKKKEQHVPRKEPQVGESEQVENDVIRLKNIGANPNPKITGLEELPGKSNYFIGNDPQKWRTSVSSYAKVRVQDAYPGIDLVYYGNQRELEYDWIVAPGADPNTIRFVVESKGDLKIDSQGNLILDEKDKLCLKKPLIYQERDSEIAEIAGEYVVLDRREVGIQVSKYDTALPLVIDPILVYSTYLGGYGEEIGYGIAVDTFGNAYVTGTTSSPNFPTANPFQASKGGGNYDIFVTKLNASGNTLVYSTYLGGSRDDAGIGIAVDTFGNAFVTGETESTDFPTVDPFQASHGGGVWDDAYVTKLNAAGNALVYSTYLGGAYSDAGNAIAIDASGNVYVSGQTLSANFPTANPFQASYGGGSDVFVSKLNASGDVLVYSTYLGGSGLDVDIGIAVDSSGNAYVTGTTTSTNFPTANPFQASYGGGSFDAFTTKLNIAGNGLVYSTYLGGSGDEIGYGIAVDAFGNAYMTGKTQSTNFPTENPLQASNGGIADVFVTKLNTGGNALVYSTYLGGSGDEIGYGIAVDTFGNVYVTGRTKSINFPTENPIQANYGGGDWDAFVTKLNTSGNTLVYSTFLGGNYMDHGWGIAVDTSGNAFVTGETESTDFPTANPFQASKSINSDAFVTKIGIPSDFLRRGVRKRIRGRIVR